MKTKTYAPEQIVRMLRQVEAGQAEGKTVEEKCRTLGIGDSTYHRWKNQYGGMKTDEVRRLKELERAPRTPSSSHGPISTARSRCGLPMRQRQRTAMAARSSSH